MVFLCLIIALKTGPYRKNQNRTDIENPGKVFSIA